MTTHILTAYPLTQGYRQHLETQMGLQPNYVLLNQLRSQSIPSFLKALRNIKGNVMIAIEDPNSLAILPILVLISHVTSAKHISIVYPDFSIKSSSCLHFVKIGFKFAIASIQSRLSLMKSHQKMKQLIKADACATISPEQTILYLNANLWFGVKAGGSIGHVAGVVNGFADKGFKVDYCAVEKNSMLNSTIDFLPIEAPKTFGIPYESNYYRFNQLAFKQLSQELSNKKYQFIYQRLSLASYLGAWLSQYFQIPLVLEYNGSEAWIAQHWGNGLRFPHLAEEAERVCLKQAKIIVTISDVLKEELIFKGVEPSRIVTYPNGIDPSVFCPENFSQAQKLKIRERFDLEPDAIVCTFVGTFGRWHGVPVLAKAIVQWVKSNLDYLKKHKIYFLIVGDGASMPEVKKILSENDSLSVCRLPGLIPQHETPGVLAASDILLSPHVNNEDGSRFFGSPTKLFEYMAMEKPIIASNLEQLGDVIKPAIPINQIRQKKQVDTSAIGILCQPGETNDILDGIRYLIENPSIRHQLGKLARQKALACYTWQHHVEAILKFLSR